MPHVVRSVPQDVPQAYFPFTPSALVLSQEAKLHRQSSEPVKRPATLRDVRVTPGIHSHWQTHVEPASEPETAFRHGGWADTRRRVRAAFARVRVGEQRADRFDQCGSACRIEREAGGKRFRLTANYCHDRFCLPCATARSRRIGAKLVELVGKEPAAHLVLTIKHVDIPLAKQLDKLIRSFAALRRHKLWKRSVAAGAYFFEVKVSGCGRYWHPHLHVIVSGTYIDQKKLSSAWHAVTTDSTYVYIKAIDANQKVLKYAAKYASKSFDHSVVQCGDRLDECMLALRGRRLCSTFGAWRGIELEGQCEPSGEWVVVGRLDAVIRDARCGQEWARGLLFAVAPAFAEREFGIVPGVGPPAPPQAS